MDSKVKTSLVIDLVALVVYLVVANPAFTSIAVHEWLGIAVFAVFVVHVAQHARCGLDFGENVRFPVDGVLSHMEHCGCIRGDLCNIIDVKSSFLP